MPPVVSIVGISGSGKTTYLEKLLPELTSRGYRIGTIKHTHHDQEFCPKRKDTWRHIEAGSDCTILNAPNGISMIKPVEQELTIEEIARFFGEDYDLIITEGHSRGEMPKIEVHRKEVGEPLAKAPKRFAFITNEKLDSDVRQFDFEDVKGVADLLVEGFIRPDKERVILYADHAPIALSSYPRDMMMKVILALAGCLKGVSKDVRMLEVFFRKNSK